jgi:hypothetical protein
MGGLYRPVQQSRFGTMAFIRDRTLAEDQDILEFHGCKCNTRRIVGLWMAGSIDL